MTPDPWFVPMTQSMFLHEVRVPVTSDGGIWQGPVAAGFAGGQKVVAAAATPEALVAVPTPCFAVWIGPPCDASGAALNTQPVFLGDAAGQNLPLVPTSLAGVAIPIDDASKIFVKVGVNGEGVNYRVLA